MAKKNDQLAGAFENENTGGLLSGLLADEEHLDRRAMFRLGTWGVASVGAVVIAVLANQSAIKTRRDDVAALDLTRQSQQIQSVARESQNETRRLASAIDTLNGDRDRLYSRLTTIEQGLDSVTGAITKQNLGAAALPAIPPSVPPKVTAPAAAATPQPVAQTAAPDPAPAVAPVTTNVAPVTTAATATSPSEKAAPEKAASEKPRADAKKPTPPAVAAALSASAIPSTPPAAPSPAPLMASKSLMGPPDAAAGKLIEPEPPAKAAADVPAPSPPPSASMASAPAPSAPAPTALAPTALAPDVAASAVPSEKPAAEKVAAAEPAASVPPPLAVKHTEFGVDVGGANSVGGLRALWRGLLKSRSNAPLAALQPIIVVKERDNGLGMQLRLVAGPLSDAAAAAKICARLAENDRPCETSVFDGQRLAFKADDAPMRTESISAKPEKPSTEKPSSEKSTPAAASEEKPAPEKPAAAKPGSNKYFHRRSYSSSKRAAVVEDPPKKPETSTGISSFFSSRIHPQ